ncbi:unnamed protein product [Colias eurytheme]|nr:unnamed protein product [Colias eurytheme]
MMPRTRRKHYASHSRSRSRSREVKRRRLDDEPREESYRKRSRSRERDRQPAQKFQDSTRYKNWNLIRNKKGRNVSFRYDKAVSHCPGAHCIVHAEGSQGEGVVEPGVGRGSAARHAFISACTRARASITSISLLVHI